MANTTYNVNRELVAIFITKKEAEALRLVLSYGIRDLYSSGTYTDASGNEKHKLDTASKKAISVAEKILSRDLRNAGE